MPDENSRISVVADDKRVVIDSIGLNCDIDPSDNLHALHWRPGDKVPGSIERKHGGGEGFRDFRLLRPYVEAWKVAKAKKDAEDAEAEAERKAHEEALRKSDERIAAEAKERAEAAAKRKALQAEQP